MAAQDKFAILRGRRRIWVVSSIHGQAAPLVKLHDALAKRCRNDDQIIYLGNYLGYGEAIRETINELLEFRCWLLARPRAFAADVVYLRGAQEEMWSKLLELQFAPNPKSVLEWLLERGVRASLTAYAGTAEAGRAAAQGGPMTLTRWTQELRNNVAQNPGHTPFFSGLKRAAYTETGELLFVHAGIDTSRPLAAQSDSFWWAAQAFAKIDQAYQSFHKVIRGFDPVHGGVVQSPFTLSIDGGAGFGGKLIALCLDWNSDILERLEV